MIVEILAKLKTPYMFSIRMWVVLMYSFWGSMAMSIVAYGIAYLRTILGGLCVKSALCQASLHIEQFSDISS